MKAKRLAFFMLALCITTGGAFAESHWSNGSGGLWTVGANWVAGTVPPNNDGESITVKSANMGDVAGTNYLGPTIQTGDALSARRLDIEVGTADSITLTMTGGTLTMTRSGGTNNRLRLGAGDSSGTAILNMSGGLIWIDSNGDVYIPGVNDLVRVGYGYTGQINMSNDAQIKARDMLIGADNGSYVDLSDSASIVLRGNEINWIKGTFPNAQLTSNGGTVTNVAYSYDSGTDETTITATSDLPPDLQPPYNLAVAPSSGLNDHDPFNLTASAYWSAAGYTFTASQWQLSTTTDFSTPAWDSGIIGPTTSVFIAEGTLPEGSYFGRVRYQGDAIWSDWSDTNALVLVKVRVLAYWRFEDGINGQEHPADFDNWYQDISGNGNHMATYGEAARPVATDSVPFDRGAGIGVNNLSLHFEDIDEMGTIGDAAFSGMPVNDISFTNGWTIECSFNARELGNRVPFGKNGFMALDAVEQPFAFKILSGVVDGLARLECIYWDDNRTRHASRTDYIVDTNKWYSAVATHDTETFSFYLKSEDDSGFTTISSGGGIGRIHADRDKQHLDCRSRPQARGAKLLFPRRYR